MRKFIEVFLNAPLVEVFIAGLLIEYTNSSPWFYLLLFVIAYIRGIDGAVRAEYMHETLVELAIISKWIKQK